MSDITLDFRFDGNDRDASRDEVSWLVKLGSLSARRGIDESLVFPTSDMSGRDADWKEK